MSSRGVRFRGTKCTVVKIGRKVVVCKSKQVFAWFCLKTFLARAYHPERVFKHCRAQSTFFEVFCLFTII